MHDAALITPCVCASERTSPHESKLVFQVVGGQYFLWQIWTQGYDAGRQLSIKQREIKDSKRASTELVVIPATITKA